MSRWLSLVKAASVAQVRESAVSLFVVWRASVLLSRRRLLLLLSLSDLVAVDLAESGCLQDEMRVVHGDVARFGCLAGAHRVEG